MDKNSIPIVFQVVVYILLIMNFFCVDSTKRKINISTLILFVGFVALSHCIFRDYGSIHFAKVSKSIPLMVLFSTYLFYLFFLLLNIIFNKNLEGDINILLSNLATIFIVGICEIAFIKSYYNSWLGTLFLLIPFFIIMMIGIWGSGTRDTYDNYHEKYQ